MRSDHHPPEVRSRRACSRIVRSVGRGVPAEPILRSVRRKRLIGTIRPAVLNKAPRSEVGRGGWAVVLRRLGVFALVAWAAQVQAASAPDAFEQANQLYERGQFAEAAAAYETLVGAGTVSPALLFNLGNAHFKAGHVGRALLNYHRAEELAPRDPDIRANLQFARNSVLGASLRPANRWIRWLPRLTLNEAAFVAAIAFWVWLGLLTLRQLRPTTRRPLRAATVLAGLLTVILVAFTAANWHLRRAVLTAIVVVPEATVHHGPLDESPSAFSVRDGFELEATDTKGDWLQVTDAARRIGWLKQEHAVLFPVMAGRAPRR